VLHFITFQSNLFNYIFSCKINDDVVRLILISHCLSLKDAELYKLGHASHFHYLNQSKTYDLEGTNNEDEYWKTKRAMDIVGISRKDQVLTGC